MIVARSFADAAAFGSCAVTIGNFDGVHAGHRRLLCSTLEVAQERNLNPVCVTFDPHPLAVVAPARVPRLLTTLPERSEIIAGLGIERMLVLPFTPEVARLAPEQFAAYLKDSLGAAVVVVGDNFRFGHKHAGNSVVLTSLGATLGFETRILPGVCIRGRVVSSSEVRALLDAGRVGLAARLLERPHAITGDVVKGHGIGSKQTVPTLNLRTHCEVIPQSGVYITGTTDLADKRAWNSITNIGHRPTFGEQTELSIETFLLQPLEDAPPSRIRVEFLRRVRAERKFSSPEELKSQILRDVSRAQVFFRRAKQWIHPV